jgi:REP element-mobilizing transposase RayT
MSTFHARVLPHYHNVGQPTFLTWNLHGAIPEGHNFPPSLESGEAFLLMDRILDEARTGPSYLKRPEIAKIIIEAIRYRNGAEYDLHNFVVMSNHVHMLVTPRIPVAKFMQSLKRFTARQANLALGFTSKTFWQPETYDRLVRDPDEFKRIATYIEMNPVKAGLVAGPEEFPWSSASTKGTTTP